MEKLNYIHQNPVRAGWVARTTDIRRRSVLACSRHWFGCLMANHATDTRFRLGCSATILNACHLRFGDGEAGHKRLCVMCEADAVHAVS